MKCLPPSRILQSSIKTTAPALFWQTHSIIAGFEVSPASRAAFEKPSIACGSRIASVLPVLGPGEYSSATGHFGTPAWPPQSLCTCMPMIE